MTAVGGGGETKISRRGTKKRGEKKGEKKKIKQSNDAYYDSRINSAYRFLDVCAAHAYASRTTIIVRGVVIYLVFRAYAYKRTGTSLKNTVRATFPSPRYLVYTRVRVYLFIYIYIYSYVCMDVYRVIVVFAIPIVVRRGGNRKSEIIIIIIIYVRGRVPV